MPPTPLLYLAAALRDQNIQPVIHDLSLEENLTTASRNGVPGGLGELIDQFQPGLFAINCFTSMHFPYVSHIAEALSSKYANVPIVLGGAHPSLFPREIIENCSFVDFVVGGEGEEQIVLIAQSLSQGGIGADFSHIQSLMLRKNGKPHHQPRESYVADIDALPDPAWDLVTLKDYYSDHSEWNNPKNLEFDLAVPILTSRSCPFSCNFCAANITMGQKFRTRSPQRVVDEIQMLHEHYGENYFSFLDDNMNLKKEHILRVCSEISRRGLNIQYETLSGLYIGALDRDVIEALDQSGCVFVRLAIEHGNDYIRNEVIGKRLQREKIYEVCAILKEKEKIRTASMFIMGFPEDTCETLEDTRKMIIDLEFDVNQVSNLMPFPGTRVFEQARRDGLLLRSYDVDRLWSGDICLDPTESEFFIKPYNMTVEELSVYRQAFDDLRVQNLDQ